MRFDYVTVGHVTIDVIERDGSSRSAPGGGAFYSALQASRLGLSTLIVTQGLRSEIEELLEPYSHELSSHVICAEHTTSFATSGSGEERVQRLLSWAGPIERLPPFESSILHLAPVAQETPKGLIFEGLDRARFLGFTPQGLVRRWSEPGGEISSVAIDEESLPERYDAAVFSELERESCEALLRTIPFTRAVIAVTAGSQPTSVHVGPSAPGVPFSPSGFAVPIPRVLDPVDDLGAGDVFAAAFFVALHEGASPPPVGGPERVKQALGEAAS